MPLTWAGSKNYNHLALQKKGRQVYGKSPLILKKSSNRLASAGISSRRCIASCGKLALTAQPETLPCLILPSPEIGLLRPANGGRDRHLAFAVDGLSDLSAKLAGSGLIYNLSQTGRRALFCRDPDDNALEFIES